MISICECSECGQHVFKFAIMKLNKAILCNDCLESYVYNNSNSKEIVRFMEENALFDEFYEVEEMYDNYQDFIESCHNEEFVEYYTSIHA